ncbi:MAG: Histone deacetylase superfamily [Verrucomicrobiales bacterium]|nr:Histone deacetylase superfamily [Verrucomicrobiales bacterium]
MKVITDSRCTEYSRPGHPERPKRISSTVEKLKAQTELPIDWLEPLPVSDEQILRAHTPELVAALNEPHDFDADTPAHPGIAAHARRSVGAGLHALKLCREGEVAFSLMRPPGHHAEKKRAMGFCYLNSIAIAALEAKATGAKKVAVFDFDVHHGNGTENILLDREGLSFYSIHQWPAYPGTGQRNRGENVFNFPVAPESPAYAYRDACHSALEHLHASAPDIIAVSAGFDSFKDDLLCQQNMEVQDFYWLGKTIRELNIPTFSLLEGGYSKALPELIFAYLKGLSGL